MDKALAMKGSPRLLNAWAFYDWANSVYSLTVVSAIFPLYLGTIFRLARVEEVVIFGGSIARTPLINYVTAAAFVIIAVITPFLSGIPLSPRCSRVVHRPTAPVRRGTGSPPRGTGGFPARG